MGWEEPMTLSLSLMISLLKKSPILIFTQWLSCPPPPILSLMPSCKSTCLNSSGHHGMAVLGSSKQIQMLKRTQSSWGSATGWKIHLSHWPSKPSLRDLVGTLIKVRELPLKKRTAQLCTLKCPPSQVFAFPHCFSSFLSLLLSLPLGFHSFFKVLLSVHLL